MTHSKQSGFAIKSNAQQPCWLMLAGSSTTQDTGDYHHIPQYSIIYSVIVHGDLINQFEGDDVARFEHCATWNWALQITILSRL